MEIKIAVRGKTVARATVGRGFFARFSCVNDVPLAGELFERIMEQQRAWGCEALVGPVSMEPNRLAEGIRTRGFSRRDVLSPTNEAYYEALLVENGFSVLRRDLLYEIPAPDMAPFRRMATRFGAEAARVPLTRETCEAVARVAGVSGREAARTLGSLKRPKIALARVRGELAGYMVLLENGPLSRISSLAVLPEFHFRGASAALLLAAAGEIRAGAVEAGAIDAENRASAAMAERAAGREIAELRLYQRRTNI